MYQMRGLFRHYPLDLAVYPFRECKRNYCNGILMFIQQTFKYYINSSVYLCSKYECWLHHSYQLLPPPSVLHLAPGDTLAPGTALASCHGYMVNITTNVPIQYQAHTLFA